jgi:hypothetical protein
MLLNRRETTYTLPRPGPAKLSTVIHGLSSVVPGGMALTGAFHVAPPVSDRKTWTGLLEVNASVAR